MDLGAKMLAPKKPASVIGKHHYCHILIYLSSQKDRSRVGEPMACHRRFGSVCSGGGPRVMLLPVVMQGDLPMWSIRIPVSHLSSKHCP